MVKNTDLKSVFGQLEGTLETYLVDKAPYTLPDNVKEITVSFAPWISIIVLLLAFFFMNITISKVLYQIYFENIIIKFKHLKVGI